MRGIGSRAGPEPALPATTGLHHGRFRTHPRQPPVHSFDTLHVQITQIRNRHRGAPGVTNRRAGKAVLCVSSTLLALPGQRFEASQVWPKITAPSGWPA